MIQNVGAHKTETGPAMMCHLATFLGLIIPLGHIIGPLFAWLFLKKNSRFVDYHGRESLNFQLSVTLYVLISFFLTFIFIGIIGLVVVPIFWFIMTIIAAVKANTGEYYRYPLTIRFFKTKSCCQHE